MTIAPFPTFVFGLALPVTEPGRPIDPALARAVAERIAEAAHVVQQEETPAARASEVRGEAERYLAARRRGALHLPFAAQRACDEGARAVMRLTLNAPPLPFGGSRERLVA